MSDQGGPEDLDSIRAEVDRLKNEVEKLEARPQKRARLRKVFAVVFIVLAVLAFSAATPGVWARRTVYDSDRYLAVVGPLASDPAIQEALARQLTQAVFTAVDVQAKVQAALAQRAPKLGFVAGPLTSSLQGFVQDQAQKVIASDQFQRFWLSANETLQKQVVAVLDGNSAVLTVQGNQVVFNYLPLLNDALTQLSGTLSAILNRQITLPTITPDTVPSQAVLGRSYDSLPAGIRNAPEVDSTKTTQTVVYRLINGKGVVTPVTVGASDVTRTVIKSGLKEDDPVITGPFKVLETIAHDQAMHSDGATTKPATKPTTAPTTSPTSVPS